MTRNKAHALWLAAAIALCGLILSNFIPAASAQSTPPSQKIIKTHYVVVQMSPQSLQVHSDADDRELHNFTFSPEVRAKMLDILNAGGYQYGDKVVIWHKQGDDVALKITGKPSKPK